MDLSWLGSAGLATVIASLFSGAVAVYLDRRRHPGPDLRIEAPATVEDGGMFKFKRRFRLVNVGPDPAYDVSAAGGPVPIVTTSLTVGDETRRVAPSLGPGESAVLDIAVLDESGLGRAKVTLRWNTRSGRERTNSSDRSSKSRSWRLVDLL